MFYLVYKITNLKNLKFYIGCHKTSDINDNYMGSGKLIKVAILKYGIKNFRKDILFVFDNPNEMFTKEIELINSLKPQYNLHKGGNGGWTYFNSLGLTETQKNIRSKNGKIGFSIANDRLKDKLKDKDFRDQWIKNIKIGLKNSKSKNKSSGMLNKKHSDETKFKMSISHSGKFNSNYGKKWIYNEEIKKSVSVTKTEIDKYISSGWKIGRKIY